MEKEKKIRRGRHSVRLLAVDEAIAVGGVERMWLSLMPALAQRCGHLVWMLPDDRIERFRSMLPPANNVEFASFHWPTWSAGKLKRAVGRRIARIAASVAPNAEKCLSDRLDHDRLQAVIDEHRITHVIYPALFRQSFPEVSVPVLAVVMDVNYHPSIRRECLTNLARWAARAARLLTISDFTREEVVRLHPDFAHKVVAIPIASSGPSVQSADLMAESLQDRQPCLYFPASFNPHKGHAVLLEAVRLLHAQDCGVRLLLTGAATSELQSPAPLAIAQLEQARAILAGGEDEFRRLVEVRGLVSADEVETCFAQADLVVLPSLYEGFGLPLAEAVARGKRVLCADLPAFREQVLLYGFTQAVTFIATGDPTAWADAIRLALSGARRAPYSSGELSSLFDRWTWSDVARRYVEAVCA